MAGKMMLRESIVGIELEVAQSASMGALEDRRCVLASAGPASTHVCINAVQQQDIFLRTLSPTFS